MCVFEVAFADLTPYMLATKQSLSDINERLEAHDRVKITNFRPSIVVDACIDNAWQEVSTIGRVKWE